MSNSQRMTEAPNLSDDSEALVPDRPLKPTRLLSLDAYRGFIMIMLAAAGFGIARLARLPEDAPVWQTLDYDFWQRLSFHFHHPTWHSRFGLAGVSFWDLIQPAFMFMVGVAMPYSHARRGSLGHSPRRRLAHAVWRGLVLVLLGVFLQSQRTPQTNWIFTNVLSQIGLGYVFLYLLMGRSFRVQLAAFAVIPIGYWLFFFLYTAPDNYDYAAVKATPETILEGRFAPWSKNANIGYAFDRWLLNRFPRPNDEPFVCNAGGYITLNFVPSIATMLLGLFCGQLLRSERKPWHKFGMLVAGGAACMILGIATGELACPVIKAICTPSFVLFSGAYVIWMLAAFYLVFDLLPGLEKGDRSNLPERPAGCSAQIGPVPFFRSAARWLAFPLVVVGMNSIAMYMMGQIMRPWTVKMVRIHLSGLLESILGPAGLADDMYGRLVDPTAAFVVFWLIAFWMYRQKFFVKI